MKNIHLIPTDKPSRLYYNNNDKQFQICKITKENTVLKPNQNIYITSNKDIKDNDYIITKDGRLIQVSFLLSKDVEGATKVVLTTDEDLIKNGVQFILNEFLVWFIKNQSCEYVKIKNSVLKIPNRYDDDYRAIPYLKLIIPKEEPNLSELKINALNLTTKALQLNSEIRKFEKVNWELSVRLENSLKQFNINLDEALNLPNWKLKTIGFSDRSIKELRQIKEEPKLTDKIEKSVLSLRELLNYYVNIPVGKDFPVSLHSIITNAYNNGVEKQKSISFDKKEIMNALHKIEIKENRNYIDLFESLMKNLEDEK